MAFQAISRYILAVLLVLGTIVGGKAWLDHHDTTTHNAALKEAYSKIQSFTTTDTNWVDMERPATHDSKPGKPIVINATQRQIDSAIAAYKAQGANKDSIIEIYMAPRQAVFEYPQETVNVTYIPFGGEHPFLFNLDIDRKPIKVPVITQHNTIVMPAEEPYNSVSWNPRLHADIFPITQDGLEGGISVSLWSYGKKTNAGKTLLYAPYIGIATEMQKRVTIHAGARINIGYFIGQGIQDTHLTAGYGIDAITKASQIMIGIGTGL